MIDVKIDDKKIIVRGHAPRDEPGRPSVVCAAVSAAVQTVLTGLELAGNDRTWTAPEEHGGFIEIDKTGLKHDETTAFLLALLKIQLERIAEAAPQAIQVTDNRTK